MPNRWSWLRQRGLRQSGLTEWRMCLAEQAVGEENAPVGVLARPLGCTSESTFSSAFKRFTGSAPKRYGDCCAGGFGKPQSSTLSVIAMTRHISADQFGRPVGHRPVT